MNQILNFMERFKDLLFKEKKRSIRPPGKNNYRDKMNIGNIAYIYINCRTKRAEKIGNGVITNKLWFNIDQAPTKNKCKKTISPLKNETWYEFAINDGFNTYSEFLDYFQNYKLNTKKKIIKDFILFQFEKQITILDFI